MFNNFGIGRNFEQTSVRMFCLSMSNSFEIIKKTFLDQ